MDYSKILGANIRQYRKRNKVTQIQLAEKLGVADRYVSNIELGYRKPRFDTLIEICNFFDVELSDLLPLKTRRELSPKDQMIYEISVMCKSLEMDKIGIVKTMICAMEGQKLEL